MSAIIVGPSPIAGERVKEGRVSRGDYMSLAVRMKVAGEINRLWREFVDEMYDGPLDDPNLPDKFWKYVLAGG